MAIFRRPLLAALTSLVAVAAGALVHAAPAQATVGPVELSQFTLHRNADSPAWQALIGTTDRVSVPTVLDSSNRTATRIASGDDLAVHFAAGFYWEQGDNNTEEWWPQGITTSSDASENGLYGGRKLVLVSWYDKQTAPEKGVRVSFIDRTDPLKPVYRHVLLAEPAATAAGQPSFKAIDIHAGGMFLYGPYLYVADTEKGFRIFDMRYIFSATGSNDAAIGRDAAGKYNAYGYKYVLPQKFSYTLAQASKLNFSFAAVDRTNVDIDGRVAHSVLAGEYHKDGVATKLVRWFINHSTGELMATDSQAKPWWAYQVDINAMQGATVINNTFYICRTNGEAGRSDLLTWKPGNLATIHAGVYPPGGEDLTYRGSTDELWTVIEYPGTRSVLSVTAGKFA